MSSSNLATASAKEVLEHDERLILKDNEGKKGRVGCFMLISDKSQSNRNVLTNILRIHQNLAGQFY